MIEFEFENPQTLELYYNGNVISYLRFKANEEEALNQIRKEDILSYLSDEDMIKELESRGFIITE